MSESAEYTVCPVANICEASEYLAPPCGDAVSHLAPLELAEDLCPTALLKRISLYTGREAGVVRVKDGVGRKTAIGWLSLELAMAVGGTESDHYFDQAASHFGEMAESEEIDIQARLQARHTLNYIPAMMERKATGTVSYGTVAERYRLLGTEIDASRAAIEASEGPIALRAMSQLAEFAFAGLLLRTYEPTLFPYAASAREEAGYLPNQKLPRDHHDYYLLDKGKIPVQVKWQRRDRAARNYAEAVSIVNLRALLGRVHGLYYNREEIEQAIDKLSDAMSTESQYLPIANRPKGALNLATELVTRKVFR